MLVTIHGANYILTLQSLSSSTQGDGSNNRSGVALTFRVYELYASAGRDLKESGLLISI